MLSWAKPRMCWSTRGLIWARTGCRVCCWHCTIAWRASHLWGAYLIQQGVSPADALTHTRAINLMDNHRMSGDGTQPIESFLGRKVPGLGHP